MLCGIRRVVRRFDRWPAWRVRISKQRIDFDRRKALSPFVHWEKRSSRDDKRDQHRRFHRNCCMASRFFTSAWLWEKNLRLSQSSCTSCRDNDPSSLTMLPYPRFTTGKHQHIPCFFVSILSFSRRTSNLGPPKSLYFRLFLPLSYIYWNPFIVCSTSTKIAMKTWAR